MSNFRKYFVKAIKSHFSEKSAEIVARIDNHYTIISIDSKFAKTSPNPIDRRLDFCSYFLALIKTLDEQGETYEDIRTICLEIVTEFVKPKNKLQELVKRLPAKLTNTWIGAILINEFNKRISKNPNPDGFIATIITDKQETFGLGYGIDILECGICKLFNKHDYKKYASILCEVDEITSALAGLQLVRKGTIALGAAKCDFRFKKTGGLILSSKTQ